ncbi:Sec1-like protein [Pseudocohnilembus persalinus]|uniref:Sec1-like protein n=1 Tax=Pseudocohnilembus persalinus TaxID=266149 RepID=A0A0V0QTA2_PSEPJ|nr:Sec1-like protein [Pseudocohnilembus persalinus]|eukprot:KRX05444.1 Sec1-like protein [Pseudocohnilembus persalinus]
MIDLGKVNDIVWKKYKHKHIGEALEGIPEELNGFIQTNNAARMAQAKNGGEQNIEQIMAVLPSYQEFLQQFQMNIHLSEAISNKVMELNLKDIGELEQALCTGILNNGKQTSSQQLIQDFIQFSINQKFRSETDKLRVAILIFITLELNNKDANQIYNCLNQEQKQTINNLQWLGIQKQDPQNIQRTTKRVDQNIRRYAKRLLKNQKQDLCRHTPYIKLVFEQIFNEILQSENQQLNFQRLSLECININEKHNKPQFNQTVQESKNNQGTNKKPKQYQNNSDEDLDEEHEENKNLITKDTIKKQIQKLKQEENDSLSGKLGYNNSENLKNPKVIAFLVGGLTYPEIRILDNLSKEYKYESINFVMGGTQLLNQQQFIDSLNNMAHFQQ